jgi:hypothetical protein
MPTLEEVGLGNENSDSTNWDEMGEQIQGFKPLLPPGEYEFNLPLSLKDCWSDAFDTKQGKRAALMVDLVVTNARDQKRVGDVRRMRINGAERNRAKKGDPERLVSDLAFFYRDALQGKTKPKGFTALAKAVGNEGGGKRFVATVEWSAFCNKKTVRYIMNAEERAVKDTEGELGCGANYYMEGGSGKAIPKNEDGSFHERFECTCGAALRCFDGLTRFKQAKG